MYSSRAAFTVSFLVRCRPSFCAWAIKRSSMARLVGIRISHNILHIGLCRRKLSRSNRATCVLVAENGAGESAGGAVVVDDECAVDEDIVEADGIRHGLVESGCVLDLGGVEDEDVGAEAGAEATA